jgi:uncharacterized cupredoxin-like copper-binding protein
MGEAVSGPELESSLSTLDIWLIVFGVFVAIGVVGESLVGFLHWRTSGQLQAVQTAENLAQQKEIGRLSVEAETAKSEIASANERTANLMNENCTVEEFFEYARQQHPRPPATEK